MTKETTAILSNNLVTFCLEAQRLIQQGFEFDIESPPDMLGFSYHARMIKDTRKVDDMIERLQTNNPKQTRAEILEKARAARGKNKNGE